MLKLDKIVIKLLRFFHYFIYSILLNKKSTEYTTLHLLYCYFFLFKINSIIISHYKLQLKGN